MDKNPASSRLPSLDGWRAISIAIVLAAHSRYAANFPAGWMDPVRVVTDQGSLGVRFFFVISGFLITWLLLGENTANAGNGISLKNFYIRRVLRIFPVYFAFLAVLTWLQMSTPFHQTTCDWVANLTFTTNIFGIWNMSGHLWSLAIEEQFYLIWPGLFLLAGAAANLRKALWILSIPILIGPVSRIVACKHYYPDSWQWFFGHEPTTSFLDSLAMGCGCALLLFNRRQTMEKIFRKNFNRLALAGFLLVAMPMVLVACGLPARLQALLDQTMQGFGFSILLLQSVMFSDRFFYRLLNIRLVKHLGMLSYSIYIWQEIFINPRSVGIDPGIWWMSFPGWLVPVLLAAHLSYYGLEMPFFRLRKQYGSSQKAVLKPSL